MSAAANETALHLRWLVRLRWGAVLAHLGMVVLLRWLLGTEFVEVGGCIATLAKRIRRETPRSLWLDSGDSFQGAPVFNMFKGEAEMRSLSLAGMDAQVVRLADHYARADRDRILEQLKARLRIIIAPTSFCASPRLMMRRTIVPASSINSTRLPESGPLAT